MPYRTESEADSPTGSAGDFAERMQRTRERPRRMTSDSRNGRAQAEALGTIATSRTTSGSHHHRRDSNGSYLLSRNASRTFSSASKSATTPPSTKSMVATMNE